MIIITRTYTKVNTKILGTTINKMVLEDHARVKKINKIPINDKLYDYPDSSSLDNETRKSIIRIP